MVAERNGQQVKSGNGATGDGPGQEREEEADLNFSPQARSPKPRLSYAPSLFGSLQALSNGNRQARGAINWWIALGPQDPGA